MAQLPNGWVETKVDQIAEIVSGGTPKSSNPDFFSEDHDNAIAWITPADLSGYAHRYISHGKRSITDDGYNSCSAKKLPKGSVLFSSRAPIGYVAIAENEMATNQGFKSFVPEEGIDSTFLYFYLKSIRLLAERLATGTTFKEISGKVTKTLPIPLPPLSEQARIVEKLDEVLAQVDTIKARLDGIPNILKRFRQSVLASAVSGRLTEEWREVNSTSIDLESFGNAKEEFGFNKHKEDLFNLAKSTLPEIPDEWLIFPAGELFSYVTSGSRGWAKYYSDSGALFIRMTNLKYLTTEIDLDDVIYVDLPDSVEGKRSKVEFNDLLISITADVGRVAVIQDDLGEAYINQHVALVRLNLKQYSQYLAICIAAENIGIKQVSTLKRGATKAGLGLDDLRSLAIPIPSMEEQTEIVRLVDQYFAFADTIEAQVDKARARVDKLTQSILAKAFRGELVPQDPNDEPADKLLERIQVARQEAEALAKATKKAANAKKRAAKA